MHTTDVTRALERYALTAMLALPALAASSCKSEMPDASARVSWSPARQIPADVDVAVFFTELAQLSTTLRLVADTAPPALGLGTMCEGLSANLALDPCSPESWERAGLDLTQPVALVLDGPDLVFVVGQQDARLAVRWRDGLVARKGAEWEPSAVEDALAWSSPDASGALIAREGGWIVSVPAPDALEALVGPVASRPAAEAAARWARVRARTSWGSIATHRMLRDDLIPHGPFHAIARPERWVKQSPASNQRAADLRERVGDQSARVGVSGRRTRGGDLQLRILNAPDRGAPSVMGSLGAARGTLPPLGGLIEPGVLGIARVAVDPASVVALVMSALDAEQRQQVDALVATLKTEAALDVQDAVVDNLTGNAVAVFYGVDARALTGVSPMEALLSLVTLDPTREALYLPIERRESLALFLDALTQLSQGRLIRKRLEGVTQYAWVEDDQLVGAAILADAHVVLVDSAVAFDHALGHANAPRELAPALAARGVGSVLDGSDRSGVYLDVGSLSSLLSPDERERLGPWLTPISHVVLVTRESRGIGVTDVTVGLAR